MRKKDIENRIKLIEDRLTLATTVLEEEFLEKLGKKGLENFINESLEEYRFWKKVLNKWPKDNDGSKSEEK